MDLAEGVEDSGQVWACGGPEGGSEGGPEGGGEVA